MCHAHAPVRSTPAARRHFGRLGSSALALALVAASQPAASAPPAVNLTVQIREIAAGEAAETGPGAPQTPRQGYSVSTLDTPAQALPVMTLQLLNGTRSVLRIERSEPFQWVQAAQVLPTDRAPKSAAAAGRSGAAVASGLGWSETGHSVALTAHWPGGRLPVLVDIVFDSASPTETNASELPGTRRQHAQSTLAVPFGRWVTFAKIGGGGADGASTWSTLTPPDAPQRWWQLMILAP